jgi:hypothetical protein
MVGIEGQGQACANPHVQDVCLGADIEGVDDMLVSWGKKPLEDIVVDIGVAGINPFDIFEIHPPPSGFLLGRTTATRQ